MTTTFAEPRLTPAQVAAYHRDGYLIPGQPVFSPEKFAGLKACFEKILANLPGGDAPESMDVPHFMHPELLQWACDDAVLDLVEPITGPDITLFSTHFICKPRGNGKRVPWHEDAHYWRSYLDRMEVVTVWLALDPSLRENGCMMVIPGSHVTARARFSDYRGVEDPSKTVFASEIIKEHRDDSRRVYVELQPNHCSLHDAHIQHGSDPNNSDIRRCGWTLRFMSSSIKFHSTPAHQIYLARGRDLAGNTYADPTRTYPEIMALRGASSRYKNAH